ncbi:MAG: T9SS type A sorting domain-containing protein [Flavobacteriales bacterium]|nr:T9SS type A sorting domain-containing protein [Flavobacteriales bacterium]MCB9193789.1 T9SS type A sorting domain-containing protein [Flavobacteriales bacterium]
MNRKYTLFLGVAMLLGGLRMDAQIQEPSPCGSDDAFHRAVALDPTILERQAELEQFTEDYIAAHKSDRDDDEPVYIIPVVFHILYNDADIPNVGSVSYSQGLNCNISDDQIYDAMRILNRDYRKLNPDTADIVFGYDTIAADIKIEFRLATIDPYGNCTNGIDRINSVETFVGDDGSKLDYWFRFRYLNVWVVDHMADGVAGYAYYPSAVTSGFMTLADGVMIRNDYIGSIGTSIENNSRALTHEIGHTMNLQHPWGNTNDPTVACGDDGVEDTPITKGHNSCTPLDLTDITCSSQALDTLYNFASVTTSSGTVDPSPLPTVHLQDTLGTGLTLSPFTAVGLSPNSAEDGRFAFSQWEGGAVGGETDYAMLTGQLNTSKYYEFTVTPLPGKAMTINGLTFRADRSLTGPRTFSVRSNFNNSFSANLSASMVPNNAAVSFPGSNVFFFNQDTTGQVSGCTVSVNYVQVTSPITFRIYGWNAEDTDGTFSVDDVKVRGMFGVVENTQNYMDYSYCSVMFTNGQKQRMRAALTSSTASRSTLWTPENLAAAGVDGVTDMLCTPEPDLYPLDRYVCQDAPVTFHDNTHNATPTSWLWEFPNGNPATSTDQNPTVSFTTPGWKSVTLTTGNDQGAATSTIANAIFVAPTFPEVVGLLNEPFDQDPGDGPWFVDNLDNNQTAWTWNNSVGHNAPGCMKLNTSQHQNPLDLIDTGDNDLDVLITPVMDLSNTTNAELSFWYAYSAQSSTPDALSETLRIYSSTNCGQTWLLRTTMDAFDLITAGVTLGSFTPSSSEWANKTINIPLSLQTSGVRLKFVYTSSNASGDLFLDDIQMNGVVGVPELADNASLTLAPNPSAGDVTISWELKQSSPIDLSILDLQGRMVWNRSFPNATNGSFTVDHDVAHLSPGIYMVRLEHENGSRTERMVIR